nr:MAG TPA: hypothetical protein [Caudoviricetes sp.]
MIAGLGLRTVLKPTRLRVTWRQSLSISRVSRFASKSTLLTFRRIT